MRLSHTATQNCIKFMFLRFAFDLFGLVITVLILFINYRGVSDQIQYLTREYRNNGNTANRKIVYSNALSFKIIIASTSQDVTTNFLSPQNFLKMSVYLLGTLHFTDNFNLFYR